MICPRPIARMNFPKRWSEMSSTFFASLSFVCTMFTVCPRSSMPIALAASFTVGISLPKTWRAITGRTPKRRCMFFCKRSICAQVS